MKISKLLEQHFSVTHKNGLAGNLGDSYLCEYNRIYRNIRLEALKSGYKFSDVPNNDYIVLPLSQLTAILATKEIPYVDNVSVLMAIEKKIPQIAVWDDVSDNLKKNYLFHESCHAVARALADENVTREKVLSMLIEESFANTCELLAVIDANDTAHKIFYEWNSYTALFENKTNLKNAIAEIGPEVFCKIIFLGYLHSNFLFDRLEEKQIVRIAKIATERALTEKENKTIRALLKICFTLDERFKEVTTGFYMKLNGVAPDKEFRRNLDYLEKFENDPPYGNYLNKLIKVVTAL